jgi:hypothetical protein
LPWPYSSELAAADNAGVSLLTMRRRFAVQQIQADKKGEYSIPDLIHAFQAETGISQ